MGVAEIDVVYREAGDYLVEGDGDGDLAVAFRDGVGCNDNGGIGRLGVDVVGDEVDCVAERARVARDLRPLRVGVWRQVHRGPQIDPPSHAVVGGAQVLQRAPARRYRQVIRCEGGLIYPLVEGKGDGGYLVGAG